MAGERGGEDGELQCAANGQRLRSTSTFSGVETMGLPGAGLAEPLARRCGGSTAKAAVIDTAWGLYKEHSRRGATLKVTGRDIDDHELALVFGGPTCCWQLDADARQAAATDAEAEILAALQELKEGDAGLIANYLGNKTRQAVAKVANRMETDGKLVSRIGSGARIFRAVAGSSGR